MDGFLREIHTQFFKEWICIQKDKRYKVFVDNKNQDTIYIETEYGQGEITFNSLCIIELKVTNKNLLLLRICSTEALLSYVVLF